MVFLRFLNVANPFMPIVTEALWEAFTNDQTMTLMQQEWPNLTTDSLFESAAADIDFAVRFVEDVRSLKGLLGLSGGERAPVVFKADHHDTNVLKENWSWIRHLSRLDEIVYDQKGIPFVVAGNTFELVLGDKVCIDDVKKLLMNKKETLETEMTHLSKKLTNDAFKNAKRDLWQADFDLHQEKKNDVDKIVGILSLWDAAD